MKQFDEMFPSHIEIHTVGKVTPINVKQKNMIPTQIYGCIHGSVELCCVCL